MIGLIACLLGFAVLIYLSYKDWSIYLAAFAAACVVIFLTGMPFVETLTDTFISGMAQSLKSFFFLLLFGNIEAALYRDSGAGFSIATGIMKKLIRPNASSKARVLTGLSIILVICAILNLGGITAAIVAVLVYPVALEIFEVCDIPKRYILGILAAGCYTFVQSMPGTPQVCNVAAMTSLGTEADVALIPGIVGVVVEIICILGLMSLFINRSKKNGEHFERHPLDPQISPDMECPSFWISLLPILVLFVLFNFAKLNIIPCLLIMNILTLVLFWKPLTAKGSVKELLSTSASDSVPMTLSICAVTGFGTIITTSDTFQMVLDFLSGLNAHPVIICWVVIALLAFLVGGCSTCQIIGLPLIAPRLVEMGLPLSTIHRISTFASTNMDTMPYCGSVLMLLPVAHLKLNEAYPAMFITTVLSTTIGTAAVVLVSILFPGLA